MKVRTVTAVEYAKAHRISLKTAQRRLTAMVKVGHASVEVVRVDRTPHQFYRYRINPR